MTFIGQDHIFLIVDDEITYRQRIRATLEGCGYTSSKGFAFEEAADGITAVNMVKHKTPVGYYLITMDRKMHALVDGESIITDGEKAIEKIRKHDARVPVIIVTSAIPVPEGGTLDDYLGGLGASVYYVNKGGLERELPGVVNRIMYGEAC